MNWLKDQFWGLPRFIQLSFVRVKFRNKFNYETTVKLHQGLVQLTEKHETNTKQIYFYFPKRISRYFIGIEERIKTISMEYCLDQLPKLPQGHIVDVGSNIGEFSLAVNMKYPGRKYIRFEPSETENSASKINLQGIDEVLVNQPLWSHIAELDFYNKNENGDSSLFQPDNKAKRIKLVTTTLDDSLLLLNVESIALLKLEAEGAEPEILLGAKKTLSKTWFVTADLGPERGLDQARTFDEVSDLLALNDFELIGRNPGGRECFLYRNSNFSSEVEREKES
jgi:FkbM family methyltransferase